MSKVIIMVERLKKEILDVEIEVKEGENLQTVVEQFKKKYEGGQYHSQFDDYGPKDCNVCSQELNVYDQDLNVLYSENLDPIPNKETTKKRKP